MPFATVAMNVHALSAFAMATYCWMLSRILRGQLGPVGALVIALAAAMGRTSWDMGTRADPLPLALAMVALQFLLYREIAVQPFSRRLFALCFLAGIGIGAHPAAVAGVPLAIAACRAAGRRPSIAGFYVFLLGLSLFIYMPLRHHRTVYLPAGQASMVPDGATFVAALEQAVRRIPASVERLIADYPPALLVAAIPGLLLLARRHPRLAISLPLLGFVGIWASCLYPLTARSHFLEALPFHPLFALSCGYTLTPAMARRYRAWQALVPWVVLGLLLTGIQNAPPRGSAGELAPQIYAMTVQDQIEPGGRLIHRDPRLGFLLDQLRFIEGRRIDITREAAPGGTLPGIPAGETRTFYLDFEPGTVPEGYRLEHRGLLHILRSTEEPPSPPFEWDRVPAAFFEGSRVKGDRALEELSAALEAHRTHDLKKAQKKK